MSRGGIGHVAVAWIGTGAAPPHLDAVCRHLARTFDTTAAPAVIAGRPDEAFDAHRRQYESTRILKWLAGRVPPDARALLAITDQDLCIVVLTYVFGEAQVGGAAAVVSTARLARGPDGASVPEPLARARLLKEAVHEVGHAFGLTHCRSRGCVMSRANTILDVDAKGDDLCRECRVALAAPPLQGGESHVP